MNEEKYWHEEITRMQYRISNLHLQVFWLNVSMIFVLIISLKLLSSQERRSLQIVGVKLPVRESKLAGSPVGLSAKSRGTSKDAVLKYYGNLESSTPTME